MTHTPTPWNIEYGHMQSQSKIRYWQITDGQDAICNNQFCYAQDSDANSAHIVKCVNMHDELVEALKVAREEYLSGFRFHEIPHETPYDETLKKAGAL